MEDGAPQALMCVEQVLTALKTTAKRLHSIEHSGSERFGASCPRAYSEHYATAALRHSHAQARARIKLKKESLYSPSQLRTQIITPASN